MVLRLAAMLVMEEEEKEGYSSWTEERNGRMVQIYKKGVNGQSGERSIESDIHHRTPSPQTSLSQFYTLSTGVAARRYGFAGT